VSINPETKELSVFEKGEFKLYEPLTKDIQEIDNLDELLASSQENFPVYLLNQN
jgi:hypothetical protein